jgi:hypothetical protein
LLWIRITYFTVPPQMLLPRAGLLTQHLEADALVSTYLAEAPTRRHRRRRTTMIGTEENRPVARSSQAMHKPGTSGEAVRRATGRDRDEWYALLDVWGATGRRHGEIAAWLTGEHGVDSWWAQTLTVDYEQARGLRAPGGSRDGTFSVNLSRTVDVPVERLFAAFVDPRVRARWLPGGVLRERTSRPARSARFDWVDGGSRVIAGFTGRGGARSQVALTHQRLPDAGAAEEARAYWRERMVALKGLLEG